VVRHCLPAELVHALRTPLSHIIGYSEMLLEQARAAGDDGYVTDLEKVNAAGLRLLAIIEENFQGTRPADPPAMGALEAGTPPESKGA
jgi:signal transduction histidine kinase